jgi:hypothetical protein
MPSYKMSRAARPAEGIDPTSFANAVALAVEQILTTRGMPPNRNDDVQFAISPSYSTSISAKIF